LTLFLGSTEHYFFSIQNSLFGYLPEPYAIYFTKVKNGKFAAGIGIGFPDNTMPAEFLGLGTPLSILVDASEQFAYINFTSNTAVLRITDDKLEFLKFLPSTGSVSIIEKEPRKHDMGE